MRTIIAGSRNATDFRQLLKAIGTIDFVPTAIISGTARGADRLGERYAKEANIELFKFPANWDLHGKSAGYIRNIEMANNADALIALWDGKSRGTKHMIDIARKKGLKIVVWDFTA